MSLDQLRYVVTVADAGTTREAARRLHVSQPPLSRQIRLLEEEIGVDLFERSRQGMRLSPSGEIFVQRARTILAALQDAVVEVRASGTSGHLPEISPSPAGRRPS